MKKIILSALSIFLLASCANSAPVDIKYENGIYHIKLDTKKAKKGLKFISSESLISNKEAHTKSGAQLTVNAGFFDPKNQKTISYIVMDKMIVADPLFNENLMNNPLLRQNIDKIKDRTEFRVLECDRDTRFEIVQHSTPVDFACTILTSAQAGPMIFPQLRLEEEFFVVKENGKVVRDSISAYSKVERTIIALKNGEVHILIITGKNPMTLFEVRDLCKELGFDRAMAFDGGSSTSMNYKKEIDVVSTKDDAGRLLKSFLIFKY